MVRASGQGAGAGRALLGRGPHVRTARRLRAVETAETARTIWRTLTIDDVGGRRRPQQGAAGPRDGAVLDRDAAGGRPAQEDLLRTEHPGTTGGPPWLDRAGPGL